MSRECRTPRRNQNNRQQKSNVNQNSRNYNRDRNVKYSQQKKYFKLGQFTSRGQHVDDTNEGPLTQLLNSVVDHRSLYLQISILNRQVETVCDSRTSVSCLSENLFNQINENHQVKIQPSTTAQIRCLIKFKAQYPYQAK